MSTILLGDKGINVPIATDDFEPISPIDATDLALVPCTNTHPMVTRSKAGIFKPKAYATKPSPIDYTLTKPLTYKIAAQFPQWCTAMDEEF